jgi:hypothetical protein
MALGDRNMGGAEWGGCDDRRSNAFDQFAEAADTGAMRLLASFDLSDYRVDLFMAGYQLVGSHLSQRSGRYRLAVLI